jgi:hypothetical protein
MSVRLVLIRNLQLTPRSLVNGSVRLFTVSATHSRGVTDTVKDAAKSVDHSVAKAAIKGLEGIEKVTKKADKFAQKSGFKGSSSPATYEEDIELGDVEITPKQTMTKAKDKAEQTGRQVKEGVGKDKDQVR